MLESLNNWPAASASPPRCPTSYCLIGAIVGTLIGVLPGIGPIAGIALLIPATFSLNPTSAIIMLAGIYYGAMYGGSTTSILLNVPARPRRSLPVSTATAWRRKEGQAQPRHLCHRLVHRGDLGIFGLVALARRWPAAWLWSGRILLLMVFGFVVLSNVTGTLSEIADDGRHRVDRRHNRPRSGQEDARFTFGSMSLLSGIEFVAVAIGLFGIGESVERGEARGTAGGRSWSEAAGAFPA
jgi:putative tricarboxylic transport membrane protein